MTTTEQIIKECRKIIKCDTALISKPLRKMYLIIGFNRNTKDNDSGSVWVNQDGNRIDFDYIQESVVASGNTPKELIESAKKYKRLCGITWEQYFKELKQPNKMTPEELTRQIMQMFRMYEEMDLYRSEWKKLLTLIQQAKSEWCREQRANCVKAYYDDGLSNKQKGGLAAISEAPEPK
jgi:hypothetical protein